MSTKRLLTSLLVLNLVAGIGSLVMLSLAEAAGRTILVSAYRELDINDIIDHDKLQNLNGGRFKGSWTVVPDQWGNSAFRYTRIAGWIAVVFLFSNVLALATILVHLRTQNRHPRDIVPPDQPS
jgi:hypothetical protein